MPEMQIFAVTGRPVLHSLSPLLFQSLFEEAETHAVYTRLAADSAEGAMKTARAMKLRGLNITSPFKEELVQSSVELDEHASRIQAVNCLTRKEETTLYRGHNTDHVGAVGALERGGVSPSGKTVLILGAGGAGKAAAYGLMRAGAGKVILINRTFERAQMAARLLGCEAIPFEEAREAFEQTDVFISCIPTGESPIDPDFLREGLVVMDANYRNSSLLREARKRGARTIAGLDWLIQQAVPCFRLFTGQEVPAHAHERLRDVLLKEIRAHKTNLALVGFMGSGKTTVGKLLAEKIGFSFLDTDRLIEQSVGMKIPELFERKGEAFFRAKERSLLEERIAASTRTVLSLGGGAVLDENNRALIARHCRTVWLWVTPASALSRINAATRPVLRRPNDTDEAAAILAGRTALYAQVSDLVIDTETGSAETIVRRIEHEMG